ncbi:amino acid adenylation domain-containing protein [Daejeonella rubra]|uniref:Amino acid adenylation domain-containing protein n=1 Tax=Daejeonella rubra TaxID=990371 RepID=A0A1G9XWM5_9SPHI|nr:non-ribosomal peptide synthetase [Daejeonella rubra]SDN01167.1 amino acid adenylation domain-containing protein [Daejeonella rubra]
MSVNGDNGINHNSEKVFVPATESQQEVWISCLLGGDDASRSYNLSVTLNLSGELNHSFFEQSIQDLVNRHEALRSVFTEDASQVCIYSEFKPEIYFEDISTNNDDQKQTFITNYIKADTNTVFDLSNGPLYKLSLFKLDKNKHVLIFTAHHIICDGWSMGLFLEELGKIYSAYLNGIPDGLDQVNSFTQYALDQKKFSNSKEYEQIEQFWIDQFKDGVPVLDIPIDFPRPAVKTTKSARYDTVIDNDLLSEIKTLGSKNGCSLAITFRAVFEILLYKLSGQNDLVLGLPAAGQAATGNYNLMGHCINLLPIRSHLNEDITFLEYLKDRKFATLDAYDNQQFTFGSLLKKLNIPRDPARVPLVSYVFSIDMGMGEAINLEGLKSEVISNKRDYENFEIFVNATSTEADFKLEWTYNTQLFKEERIIKMTDSYLSLLYAVIKEPGIKIRDILPVDPSESEAKITGWNDTKVDYPKNTTVHEFVSLNAEKYPDKTAIKYKNSSLSYSELNEKANRIASYLAENQVYKGDTIALILDRSVEMMASLLAIMKSGAAYIPVDPDYPVKRIEYMLADSSVKLLISSAKYKGRFATQDIKEVILEEIGDQLSGYDGKGPEINVQGTDLAYVIYTSGSTGQPKGIAVEHHSLTNFLCSMQKRPGISAGDKLLAVTTISFDISGLELYLPLISGAELILTDADTAKDGRELLDLVRSEQVSIMQATPSTWRMMLESNWDESFDLKALCGGEALPKDLAQLLLEKCSSLWNMYGPTETTIWSAVKQITNSEDPITIGSPIDNTQFYILDQHLHRVPIGSTGEIYIGGEGLAREYINKSELTEKSFIKNPFSGGSSERIYRTGDLGKFMPEGEIQCFGRIDNQVKIRGYRIELGAIEEALNIQESIKESVVLAREDRPGDQRLVAYIVHQTEANTIATAQEIAAWKNGLKEILPSYMIPGDYILLEKIPLLPNGKIDRKSLPKPNEISNKDKNKELPKTKTEKLAAKIWEEILSSGPIGLTDDFFELGGHSLLAVQVMIRIEKETGIKLPLTTLFKAPTLNQFAGLIESGKTDQPDEKQTNTEIKTPLETKDISDDFVPPRTDIEKLVAEIWAEHLGIESVGVYDDFFELGGHSLMAIRVLNQLEKETGKRLPLATLFEHTTVEAMALMLKMDAKSITWDSLVAIKPHGQKMPLYIVHGAGLNVLFFNTLAKNMDPEQPVYGLQAKGLNGIDEPLEKIEDMAAYYISEIVKQNPKGPYALAGFSFGGIIAYEMAKQFKAMGKDVKMLAMFDTYAYQSDRYEPTFKKLFNSTRYLTKQLLYTFTLFFEDPKRTIEYKSEAIKRRFIQLYWKLKYGDKQNQEGFFGYANNIDIKNIQAWEKYIFTPYNGTIELFRAKKRTFYMNDFEYLGWKPFAKKGINIHEIPGEHNFIFAPPNDKEFASILQQCLDKAADKKRGD